MVHTVSLNIFRPISYCSVNLEYDIRYLYLSHLEVQQMHDELMLVSDSLTQIKKRIRKQGTQVSWNEDVDVRSQPEAAGSSIMGFCWIP